jgi:hypothetical protein
MKRADRLWPDDLGRFAVAFEAGARSELSSKIDGTGQAAI